MALRDAFATEAPFWRRALYAGVRYGPDPWVRYSPPVFGLAFAAALREPRHHVAATLRELRGPVSAWQEAREVAAVFANFASSMTEGMLAGTPRGYAATHRLTGHEHFHRCLDEGRGVIVATAHTAGWDLAGAFLQGAQEREVWVLMAPEPTTASRELHDRLRRQAGVRIVHVGHDPLASIPVVGHLRRGGIVACKFDRIFPGMRQREVTFLGHPWAIAEGPLSLAALSGAPILPVFTRRLGFMVYEVQNLPPIHLARRASEAERQAAAQTLADDLEAFARRHPTQWFRFHES
ncbi:MAG: lysophospholipid acyltransferase family protein [Polyangiaceae bacterium]